MTQGEPIRAKRRNISIDSLRGLAVILMVAGHVIGNDASRGLQVEDGSAWRVFYLALEDIRMPLFTVLSGFIYAGRPVRDLPSLPGMVRGKARRLLVPMVTVGTLFFAMQLLVPGTNSKPDPAHYWRIFFFSYEHLWFVQAIFLIFVVTGLLGAFGLLTTKSRWGASVAVSCILYVAAVVPSAINVFSINGAIRLLPFFLLGFGLQRFQLGRRVPSFVALLICAFLPLRLFVILSGVELPAAIDRALSLAVGLTAVSLLVLFREYLRWGFLARIGFYSFGIYLLHVFGSAGTRIALQRAGIESEAIVFVSCLTLAITLPIIFERIFGRYGLVSWGVLGQKPRAKKVDAGFVTV